MATELHTEPPAEMISFPEILKNHGYYTAQAGKFHMGKYALRGFDLTSQNGKLQVLKQWMDETGDNIPQNLTKDWHLNL